MALLPSSVLTPEQKDLYERWNNKIVVFKAYGFEYTVPAMVIAENRAEHYAGEYGNDVDRSLLEDTLPLFDDDDFEVADWAQGNMNPEDYGGREKLTKTPETPSFKQVVFEDFPEKGSELDIVVRDK